MPIVIGLDVASVTGVCVGEPGDKPITAYSVILGAPGESHDVKFAEVLHLTARLIREHNPVLIAIERPIKKRTDTLNTNLLLMGLVACIQGYANTRQVRTELHSISDIDSRFSVSKSGHRKVGISTRCKQLGWDVPDQDSADAAAVWNSACSTLSRSHAIANTPLFAR